MNAYFATYRHNAYKARNHARIEHKPGAHFVNCWVTKRQATALMALYEELQNINYAQAMLIERIYCGLDVFYHDKCIYTDLGAIIRFAQKKASVYLPARVFLVYLLTMLKYYYAIDMYMQSVGNYNQGIIVWQHPKMTARVCTRSDNMRQSVAIAVAEKCRIIDIIPVDWNAIPETEHAKMLQTVRAYN